MEVQELVRVLLGSTVSSLPLVYLKDQLLLHPAAFIESLGLTWFSFHMKQSNLQLAYVYTWSAHSGS